MPEDDFRPRLRQVEVINLPPDAGEQLVCLRDRLDPEARPLVMSQAALLLASLLDGQRSLAEARASFTLRTGYPIGADQVSEFVGQLDAAYLLDTERFRERLAALRREFLELPLRPATHAGGAYPGEPEELRRFLDRQFVSPRGPGGPPRPAPRRYQLQGLIAPHIDLHRGGPAYAWAYRALAEAEPVDLYVLLGTCHAGMRGAIAATRKRYDTPFGPARTDDEFLDGLARAYPGDLFEDEYQHRAEHSLEFQALFLRYLEISGADSGAACVPILCNSLQGFVTAGQAPSRATKVAAVVTALRETIAGSGKRVCLVAGADLAHVGPQFGDPAALTAADLAQLEAGDRDMLEVICSGDADGFYAQVMQDQDARRICGLAPIYLLLAVLGTSRGQLLCYDQWVDETGNGSVTFAAVALSGA